MRHEKTYASLEDGDEVFDVGLNRAVTLIAEKIAKGPSRGRFGADPGKPLGDHPSLGAVALKSGRYGAYVTAGGVNATIPSDKDKDALTLAEAIALIDERAAKGGGKPAKKAKASKPTAKKDVKKAVKAATDEEAEAPKPAKKATAKKATAKKAAAKPKPESTSKARAPVATAAKTTAAKPAAKSLAKSSAKKSAGKARG